MIINEHVELISFRVTQLGKDEVFLRYDWLNAHNPTIDWKKQTREFSQCPDMCKPGKGVREKSPDEDEEEEGLTMRRMTEAIEEWEEGDHLMCMEEKVWIRAHKNMATKLAIEAEMKKEKRTTEEIVPVHYHDFIKDVFTKESFNKLPPRKPWDHMIKLVPDAQPIDCKIYLLSLEEQKQ